MSKKIRVLIAKPGPDGHDVGAKIVSRALMDAGFEVIYTGLRKSGNEIATIAIEEDVDVIGLSILSGSHIPICHQFHDLRSQHDLVDKLWLVGGNIPRKDEQVLRDMGVDAVFPVASPLESIVDFIKEQVR